MRLFFAGGPIGELMLGSSALAIGGIVFDGPDIASDDVVDPGARRLLPLDKLVGEDSDLKELSAIVGRGCEAGVPELGPRSILSPRFDIERQGKNEC